MKYQNDADFGEIKNVDFHEEYLKKIEEHKKSKDLKSILKSSYYNDKDQGLQMVMILKNH